MWIALWIIGAALASGYLAWSMATARAQKRVTDIGFALAESRGVATVWQERATAERNLHRRAELDAEEWRRRFDENQALLRNLGKPLFIRPDGAPDDEHPLSVREADRLAVDARRRAREAALAGERAKPDASEEVAGEPEIPGEYEPVLVSERGMPPVNRLDQSDGPG